MLFYSEAVTVANGRSVLRCVCVFTSVCVLLSPGPEPEVNKRSLETCKASALLLPPHPSLSSLPTHPSLHPSLPLSLSLSLSPDNREHVSTYSERKKARAHSSYEHGKHDLNRPQVFTFLRYIYIFSVKEITC